MEDQGKDTGLTMVWYRIRPCIEGRVEFSHNLMVLLARQRVIETVLQAARQVTR